MLFHRRKVRSFRLHSVTGASRCRLELVLLSILLGRQLSAGRLAIQIGSGTIVERGVDVDPDLGFWISLISRGCWSFRHSKINQHAIEKTEFRLSGNMRLLMSRCRIAA